MAPQGRPRRNNPRDTATTNPLSPEAIEEMVSQRVAAAIAQYKLNQNSIPTGGMGDTGAGGSGTVEPRREPSLSRDTSGGCSYKDRKSVV